MIYIEPKSVDPSFHLAAEEYVTRFFPFNNFTDTNESVFMVWRTEKCVVIGRNQIAAAEIDLQAAHSLGIRVIRRSSGGGAIFSDFGNIMHSVITPFNESDDPKKIEYTQAVEPMANALKKMGIPALSEGRNDITVDGKKISGLAQYAIKNRICTHGSLLFDSDLDLLSRILKTDPDKINSKALKSIRSRVTNLREYLNPELESITEFINLLKSCLFEVFGEDIKNYDFTRRDIEQINIIKDEKYANQKWINGSTPKFTFQNSKRFLSGKLEIFLDVEHGIIKSCNIFGDFLGIHPVTELENKLINHPHEFGILSEILFNTDLKLYLGNIKPEELLECLF